MLKMQLPLYNSKVNFTEPEDANAGMYKQLNFDYLNFLKPEEVHNMQVVLNNKLDQIDESNKLKLELSETPRMIIKKPKTMS